MDFCVLIEIIAELSTIATKESESDTFGARRLRHEAGMY